MINNEKNNTKKVKYIASIIYLLALTFIVVGSYINQQQDSEIFVNSEANNSQ